HLYGFDEKTLKCVDVKGEEKWRVRGSGKGALMGADGKLIVLNGKGELIIAEASPEEFRVLSSTKVLSGGEYWTKPVLVNGVIYCRNNKGEMVARDHRGGPQASDKAAD
ncbi:MAG: alcohol dehydrogenase, partial [Chloroflexota bacterium]